MTDIEIKMTALYRLCLHAYQEQASWTEHEAVYSDSLREWHEKILKYLDFRVINPENEDEIAVSFKIRKADLPCMNWAGQVQQGLRTEK